jgi:hypothetical protein
MDSDDAVVFFAHTIYPIVPISGTRTASPHPEEASGYDRA